MLAYDEAGAIQEDAAKRLDEIITKAKAKPPTHVFIAAHESGPGALAVGFGEAAMPA